MSTSQTTPSLASLANSSAGQARSAWLREPLLHFLLLGALLFAADHYLVGRADDPRNIVVGAEVDAEAKQIFSAARGREPNAEELKALRQVWLDNEVLYREGLALQVDRGDTAIRERVIFKALSVVDANTKLPPVSEQVLRDWFEKNRVKYDEPARFDFQEAALAGDNSEATVRAFVAELNAGAAGDAKAGLRVFKGRPQSNLEQSYGADFAKTFAAIAPGEWHALQTRDGWRAMRLDALSKPQPAAFEALRTVIQQDWTDATLSEQRSAAVRALTQKYKVKFEASKP
ncbi:peptidyl-prolyl cis-trans isomerase [Paucibacter sp. TC2R-5]|uniref:peptidylprolyl isomerase n=1 Tax=Paucibacter sp. TC2R-5 TaxID=2893555 RepID=UPI0021E448A6|nr:peptidylprolyl isomerase [Paucibacter sp. TC2R-5]MCV2359855.1 peptidyl-prolyl cis-trans isomerase [Paucibacter sp. TC2R-5]